MSKYLSVREASKRLQVTPFRIRALCKEHRLQARKSPEGFWRISQDSIDEYAKNRRARSHGLQRKLIVYATREEWLEIKKILADAGYDHKRLRARVANESRQDTTWLD